MTNHALGRTLLGSVIVVQGRGTSEGGLERVLGLVSAGGQTQKIQFHFLGLATQLGARE